MNNDLFDKHATISEKEYGKLLSDVYKFGSDYSSVVEDYVTSFEKECDKIFSEEVNYE